MDIKQFKYLVAIANEGSYSRAAKKLQVSQPNLSKSMKNLENELEKKLLYIEKNRVKLTDAGKRLYIDSLKIIELFDNIYMELNDSANLATGTIKIGIPPIIGTCVLPDILSEFNKKYPGIKFEINQKAANKIQQLVFEEILDVGFTITPVISNAYQVKPIVKDKNVLIVHKNHPLSGEKIVDYSILKNEEFILLDEEYTLYGNIIAGCYDSNFEPKILMKVSNWDFVVQLVKRNMGISIIPRTILEMYPDKDIVQIDIDHRSSEWDVVLIIKKDSYKSPAIKNFIQFIEDFK